VASAPLATERAEMAQRRVAAALRVDR